MTNRLTVKVNYILDAQNNGKFNFDIFNYKNLKKTDHKTKDMKKNVKNIKIAKNLQKGSLTAIDVFLKRQET